MRRSLLAIGLLGLLIGFGAWQIANPPSPILFTSAGADTLSCPSNTKASFATTYTIPANYLTTNKLLRVFLGFTTSGSGTPPTMALSVKIGSTAVYDPSGAAPAAATSAGGLTLYIQGTAAAGASASVYVNASVPGAAGSSAQSPLSLNSVTVPFSLATNGTLLIQPQLFCSANTASNGMTLNQFVVEALN